MFDAIDVFDLWHTVKEKFVGFKFERLFLALIPRTRYPPTP